jgi:SAM-dependent methyltransferase
MQNNKFLSEQIQKMGIKKISLGSGRQKAFGYLSADLAGVYQPDIVIDLNENWQMPKDWFINIMAENIIEHVVDVPKFINQCHDCLIEGGELKIIVPYWAGRCATGDPTHIHFFNLDSLNAWTCWHDRYIHLNQRRRFQQISVVPIMEDGLTDRDELARLGFCPILGMEFTLKKIPWK